jgi:hypothetical protein
MNRVGYREESFVVERNGKRVCEILPARPPEVHWRRTRETLAVPAQAG